MSPVECSSVYLQYFGLAFVGRCLTPGSTFFNSFGAVALFAILLLYTAGQTTRVLADSWYSRFGVQCLSLLGRVLSLMAWKSLFACAQVCVVVRTPEPWQPNQRHAKSFRNPRGKAPLVLVISLSPNPMLILPFRGLYLAQHGKRCSRKLITPRGNLLKYISLKIFTYHICPVTGSVR